MLVVDTNVICEPTKKRPTPAVLRFLAGQQAVGLCAVSVMEIEAGIVTAPPGKQARLAAWLDALLTSGGVEVIPVDEAIARIAGRLRGAHHGRTIATEDLLIAATALSRGAVLATRNVKDFAPLGVTVVNPWTS